MVQFAVHDGLLTPRTVQSHASNTTAEKQVAYKAGASSLVTPKMAGGLVLLMCMPVLEYAVSMPGISSDAMKYAVPMLPVLKTAMAMHDITKTTVTRIPPKRHKHVKLTPFEHARRGHCHHGGACEICRMA